MKANPNSSPVQKYRLEPHPRYGFLRIQPTPTIAEIEQYYAESFYSPYYPRFNNSSLENQIADREFYDGFRSDLCESIREITNQSPQNLSLLDVGCGWGLALMHFSNMGFKCLGFDPAQDAVDYAKEQGLRVFKAGFDDFNFLENERFDIVTMFDVIEHLTNPVEVLERIRSSAIQFGGLLVISAPNEFNPFQMVANTMHDLKEWWIAPPAHLNYFSRESLTKLLEGTGFRVIKKHASFPMEIFLLFGENYVKDSAIGKMCHKRRVSFETNLRRHGHGKLLGKLYECFAELGIGREITVFAKAC